MAFKDFGYAAASPCFKMVSNPGRHGPEDYHLYLDKCTQAGYILNQCLYFSIFWHSISIHGPILDVYLYGGAR